MAEDLFYSEKEKILFLVAGYIDHSSVVTNIVAMLNKFTDKLSSLCQVERNKVKTYFVQESRRYANMRVFYVETETVPDNAFLIGEDWNMIKWLED